MIVSLFILSTCSKDFPPSLQSRNLSANAQLASRLSNNRALFAFSQWKSSVKNIRLEFKKHVFSYGIGTLLIKPTNTIVNGNNMTDGSVSVFAVIQ